MSQAVVMNIALDDYDLSQVKKGDNTAPNKKNDDDQEIPNTATTVGGVRSIYTLFKNRMNVVKVASTNDFQGATAGANDYYKIVNVDTKDKADYDAFATLHSQANGDKGKANVFPSLTTGGSWPANLTMLFFNDGITFIFDNTQEKCAAKTATIANDHYCFGFIDVNGQKAPNRVVACDGTGANKTIKDSGTDNATCTVSNPTDIYPIALFDQSVVPASAAARAVLYAK